MDSFNDENNINIKKEIFKYLFFWRYFVFAIAFFCSCAYIYLQYSNHLYLTTAKIKILDKKDAALELPSASDLFSSNKINLENEIEILSSFRLLSSVVKDLNLNTKFYIIGDIMTSQVVSLPFKFEQLITNDSIRKDITFQINISDIGFEIVNLKNDKNYSFNTFKTSDVTHDLPFNLSYNKSKFLDKSVSYYVSFSSVINTVSELQENLLFTQVGAESEIIKIEIEHPNPNYSEILLNKIIDNFNQDGINDRRMVYKRTIDFVNERYLILSSELDSIEVKKQVYKLQNNLIDFNANTKLSLDLNSRINQELIDLENQITIAILIEESFKNNNNELLPANLGINSNEINFQIVEYNKLIIERKNLIVSAGLNNPSVLSLNNLISDNQKNIINSLNNYLQQLNKIKKEYVSQSSKSQEDVATLPEKEKILRAIERNQVIKESLYLFLLQKREEAEVSFAVTEPSIKVVEYALSSIEPIYPRNTAVYILALLFGLLFPFLIIYILFMFDNKIHSREDLEKLSLNVLGEIPFFDLPETEKVFTNPEDRSIISESFRMLMSNVRYLQKNDSKSNVILVTSSIKGEGKTLNALNLALSFSSVGKKVLLIGCDLRNPQLHKYINYDKNVAGLVDFLFDNKTEWKKNIINPFDSQSLDLLLSGPLPPNPLNLLNNGNIDILLKDARKTYDYIIIDSAPTLLVADTQSLINKSDILIFLTRWNVTDNEVLTHIKKVSDESDTNVGVILNGVGAKNSYGYSYGYRYGYGYNYKYSYNYGYGYGYNEELS